MKKLVLVSLFSTLFFSLVSPPLWAETDKELFDRGVIHLKNDQFQKAVDDFTQLVRRAPENPDAYKNRGVAYMKLGEYDLAILDFEKTRDILPEMKGLYSNLGVAWYYKGEYKKAIVNYNKEIDLTPDNYYAFFNRAICRAELDDLTPGLEDVNRAIALSPDFYLAHCLRGDLLVKMGRIALAREAYKRAVEIDPDHDYAREQLAALPEDKTQEPGPPDDPAPSKVVEKSIPEKSFPEKTGEEDAISGDDYKVAPPAPEQKTIADKQGPSQMTEAVNPPQAEDRVYAYELQAGAYQMEKNALDMVKVLRSRGYAVRVEEVTRPNGKHWYLVRTGGFDSRSRADAAKEEMMEALGRDIIVRPWKQF